jgi:hypothetical protein
MKGAVQYECEHIAICRPQLVKTAFREGLSGGRFASFSRNWRHNTLNLNELYELQFYAPAHLSAKRQLPCTRHESAGICER